MNKTTTLRFTIITWFVAVLFSACVKDPDVAVQQGKTTIQINAITAPEYNNLQIRYNNVIDAPINVTVTFHLRDGQKKNVKVTIPANYKSLQQWGPDQFVNAWNYNEYYDSTRPGTTPQIKREWDIASVEISGVSCSNKEYGFEVLTTDDWIFYKGQELVTSVRFISNQDTIANANYDFITTVIQFNRSIQHYYFSFFSGSIMFFSNNQTFPLYIGQTMQIPLMVYSHNNRNYGSWPDGPLASSNGSTITLKITNLTSTHFDATFSGNLWSSMQPDTLRIRQGEIKNAILPEVVN